MLNDLYSLPSPNRTVPFVNTPSTSQRKSLILRSLARRAGGACCVLRVACWLGTELPRWSLARVWTGGAGCVFERLIQIRHHRDERPLGFGPGRTIGWASRPEESCLARRSGLCRDWDEFR